MTLCTGLDLSLTCSGVCSPVGSLYTLKPPTTDRRARLLWYYRELREIANEGGVFVIEQPLVYGQHGDTTIRLGELYGVAWLALRDQHIAWVNVQTLKKFATGKAGCKKEAMVDALYERAGIHTSSDDCADAWWLRAMGMAAYGDPVLELPKTHTTAIGAVTWPGLS